MPRCNAPLHVPSRQYTMHHCQHSVLLQARRALRAHGACPDALHGVCLARKAHVDPRSPTLSSCSELASSLLAKMNVPSHQCTAHQCQPIATRQACAQCVLLVPVTRLHPLCRNYMSAAALLKGCTCPARTVPQPQPVMERCSAAARHHATELGSACGLLLGLH